MHNRSDAMELLDFHSGKVIIAPLPSPLFLSFTSCWLAIPAKPLKWMYSIIKIQFLPPSLWSSAIQPILLSACLISICCRRANSLNCVWWEATTAWLMSPTAPQRSSAAASTPASPTLWWLSTTGTAGSGSCWWVGILWLGNCLSLYLGSIEQMRLQNGGQIDPLYLMMVQRKWNETV